MRSVRSQGLRRPSSLASGFHFGQVELSGEPPVSRRLWKRYVTVRLPVGLGPPVVLRLNSAVGVSAPAQRQRAGGRVSSSVWRLGGASRVCAGVWVPMTDGNGFTCGANSYILMRCAPEQQTKNQTKFTLIQESKIIFHGGPRMSRATLEFLGA
ncbi:hypothetical protein HJG60_012113 [Phyllostomus discolor]|uniref:Uncharacterized protein n=1 Tax=Phyllostomus discolor TaxID=89673 RepID=A0A833ZQ74_9CHIR|nr:hypothetical protein HJG60_012113 [Phyllostomus discolor]